MSVLKIDSSAKSQHSNSRVLTQYLVERLAKTTTVTRDLAASNFPSLSAQDLISLHSGEQLSRESLQQHQKISADLIAELKTADTLVFGVPMYNFSVPAVLKQWIDYIVKAGITFTYGANGPEGLSGVKRAYIVTSTGGTPVGSKMDFASGYVEQICKFIGIEEIYHIDASGSKGSSEAIINDGKQQIDRLLGAL